MFFLFNSLVALSNFFNDFSKSYFSSAVKFLVTFLNDDYPEFCLTRWDAGWEQIRKNMTNGTNILISLYLPISN